MRHDLANIPAVVHFSNLIVVNVALHADIDVGSAELPADLPADHVGRRFRLVARQFVQATSDCLAQNHNHAPPVGWRFGPIARFSGGNGAGFGFAGSGFALGCLGLSSRNAASA